ncbi:ribonuclease HII [Candidatus Woesebacteria bacterium]|nr:MAG: ribonuclease HII [Candidatus Woesebacteria bacterium]
MADFTYENKLWTKGVKLIGGVDEVGRGSFAGPVVAACIGFDSGVRLNDAIRINDSKQLTQKNREMAYRWIIDKCLVIGVGIVNLEEIDENGIGKASIEAMRRAVNSALILPNKYADISLEHLLIDAFNIPQLVNFPKEKQTAIIKGDTLSFSVAAASIIAKVYRDKIMNDLSTFKKYEKYAWHKNKGYGTKEHIDAIRKHGLTKHHRKLFVRNYI